LKGYSIAELTKVRGNYCASFAGFRRARFPRSG
jgi:hypothetical protein